MRTIESISACFIGYLVRKREFFILVAKLFHLQSSQKSFSFANKSIVSIKTKYVKLTKFLCTSSQGIQIIGNSASKITIRDLKYWK